MDAAMENAISHSSGLLKLSEREVMEVMNRISELSKRIMCMEEFFYLEVLPFLEKQYDNQLQAIDCLDRVQPPFDSDAENSDACIHIEEQFDANLKVINQLKPEYEPSHKELLDPSYFLQKEGSTKLTRENNNSGIDETGNPISQFSNEWYRTSAVSSKIPVNVDGKGSRKNEEISKDCVSSTSEIGEVKENILENMNIPIKAIPSLEESCIDVLNEHGLNPQAFSVVSCKTETGKLDKCNEVYIFEGNCTNDPPQHMIDVPRKWNSQHDFSLKNEEERSVDRSTNTTLSVKKQREGHNDQTAITQVSDNLNETDDSSIQTVLSASTTNSRFSHKSSSRSKDLSHSDLDSSPELVLRKTAASDPENRFVKCKNSKKRSKKSWTPSPISGIEAESCHQPISNGELITPRKRSSPRAVSGSGSSSSPRLVTLLEAATDGNISQVRRLLSQGTPVDVENEDGDQALHLAARNGHLPVMVVLLRNGAPANVANKSGDLPLHLAVERGDLPSVKLLVTKYGVDVNAKGANGRTALEIAAAAVDEKIVKFLRENEASGRLHEEKKTVGALPVPWKKKTGCKIIGSIICFTVFVILKFIIWPKL